MENIAIERAGWAVVPFKLLEDNNALRVWVALWQLSDYRSRTAVVFRREIETTSGLSDKSVQRGRRWLQDHGFLEVVAQHAGHGGIECNRYILRLDPPATMAPPTGNLFPDPPESNPTPTYSPVEKQQKKPAPAWAIQVANAIAAHVANEFNRTTTDAQRERWAHSIDKLTRSSAFHRKPTPEEVAAIIGWGLADRKEQGSWPGWHANIRSAPDADKFAKIWRSYDRDTGKATRRTDEDLQ